MKKLSIVFITVAMLLISGCSKDNKSGEANEKDINGFSFGPNQSVQEISDTEKRELSRHLKAAGKPVNGLSYYGYSLIWADDGSLVIKGFIRNNTGKTVSDISGTFEVSSEEILIAKAVFSLNKDQFGKLDNKDNRPWSLIFPSEMIREKIYNIEKYTVTVIAEYTAE